MAEPRLLFSATMPVVETLVTNTAWALVEVGGLVLDRAYMLETGTVPRVFVQLAVYMLAEGTETIEARLVFLNPDQNPTPLLGSVAKHSKANPLLVKGAAVEITKFLQRVPQGGIRLQARVSAGTGKLTSATVHVLRTPAISQAQRS